jgi:hypothetical protein
VGIGIFDDDVAALRFGAADLIGLLVNLARWEPPTGSTMIMCWPKVDARRG